MYVSMAIQFTVGDNAASEPYFVRHLSSREVSAGAVFSAS